MEIGTIITLLTGSLGLAFFIMYRVTLNSLTSLQSSYDNLKANYDNVKHNLYVLKDHSNAVTEIQMKKRDVLKTIKEAKNDEDAKNVLDLILQSNNDRVRNN